MIGTGLKLAIDHLLPGMGQFARALYAERHWRTYDQASYAKYISANSDPWGYGTWSSEITEQKIRMELELLAQFNFERGLEIGCAQGLMTAHLAPLCNSLLAVDFVPVALVRARTHCSSPNVTFAQWDLATDPVPGRFDLIVVTDVLGCFGGRRAVRQAIDKLVKALTPKGYLLYGDVVGDLLTRRIQRSWLGRLLLFRPGKICDIFSAHSTLVPITYRYTDHHLVALFQKR